MFFGRKKIDEDIERFRRANLPPEYFEEEDAEIELEKKIVKETQYEKGDFLALIVAAFSVITPYILIFIAIMAAFVIGYIWLTS